MKLYSISDCQSIYEVSDSRKVDGPLSWVAVRTKQDGFGFRRMAQERDRSELLACWILMVQVAAKQPRQIRGKLMRDDRPLTSKALSVMTGWPEQSFERALAFFSDPEQKWLICEEFRDESAHAAAPARAGEAPVASALSPDESELIRTGPDLSERAPDTGQDRTGQDRITLAPASLSRARDPVFDALASVCGITPTEMTKRQARACGVALAEIKAISPNVDQDELRTRAIAYGRRYRDAVITPSALCAHWGELGAMPAHTNGRSPAKPSTPEPENWRGRISQAFPDSPLRDEGRAWDQLPRHTQESILAALRRVATA